MSSDNFNTENDLLRNIHVCFVLVFGIWFSDYRCHWCNADSLSFFLFCEIPFYYFLIARAAILIIFYIINKSRIKWEFQATLLSWSWHTDSVSWWNNRKSLICWLHVDVCTFYAWSMLVLLKKKHHSPSFRCLKKIKEFAVSFLMFIKKQTEWWVFST